MKARLVLSSILLMLFCQNARAQERKTLDLFLGYSFTTVNTSSISNLGSFYLQGGDVSISYKIKPFITVVGDFDLSAEGHHNSNIVGIQTHGRQTSYLFGPRLSLPTWRRMTLYGQGLFGASNATHGLYDTAGSQTSFTWAAGGGLDYRLNGSFSLRPLQVDFLQSRFSEIGNGQQYQNNVRFTTGLILHF